MTEDDCEGSDNDGGLAGLALALEVLDDSPAVVGNGLPE